MSGGPGAEEFRKRVNLCREIVPVDDCHSVPLPFTSAAGWLACRTRAQYRARVQIAAATLSRNSLRQTVHTHRASVHQAAKLVAAL